MDMVLSGWESGKRLFMIWWDSTTMEFVCNREEQYTSSGGPIGGERTGLVDLVKPTRVTRKVL